MITFVTLLCDKIPYENTLKSFNIKFVSMMFMVVSIGYTPKNSLENFRITITLWKEF